MTLLSPSDALLKRKSCSALSRFRISLYRSILKSLRKSYSHYAICDSIDVDGGDIKLIHEYRDLKFERELARNRIEYKVGFQGEASPMKIGKSKRKLWFNYFSFTDTIRIDINGKAFVIKHGDYHEISGSIKSKIKHSSDIISRAEIELILPKILNSRPKVESVWQDESVGGNSKKITIKERETKKRVRIGSENLFNREVILTRETKLTEDTTDTLSLGQMQVEPTPTIEKRGFEIDTTF